MLFLHSRFDEKKLEMNNFLSCWFPELQSEYKFPDRKISIFSNLWYKSGSVLKKRRQSNRVTVPICGWFFLQFFQPGIGNCLTDFPRIPKQASILE